MASRRSLPRAAPLSSPATVPSALPTPVYLQGGLNFAASRAGVLLAVQNAYFKN